MYYDSILQIGITFYDLILIRHHGSHGSRGNYCISKLKSSHQNDDTNYRLTLLLRQKHETINCGTFLTDFINQCRIGQIPL